MSIKVTPLSDALGAEISGVDLTTPLDPETAKAINEAWLEHLVIVIRGQILSDEDQVRFGGYFGPIGDYLRPGTLRSTAMKERHRSVMFVSNIVENGEPIGTLPDGEMMFHTDTGYAQNPHKATTLYAVELPGSGGHTIFSNQYAVHDALPDALRQTLAGRDAKNAYEFGTMIKTKQRYDAPETATAIHPIFRPHSETGRMTVYVNELMTEEIVGLPEAESRAALDEVFALQREPRFLYEHVWQLGDLVMWDNRCTLHARTDFPRDQRRLLRRITVEDSAGATA
ncbi:MAG: TauD/TfdA family dioxygenase [Proteobacteria bacterium]|nr:TauD/TfdA family dioxygenase [Pseudomonadota bacterium]